MSLVTLDSHIIIWGIKEEASVGQEHMIHLAKRFFAWLDDEKHEIILTSIVLGELLMRVPPDNHAEVLSFYEKRFKVINYDALAASCFAKIWQRKNEDKTVEQATQKLGATREECKADCQIVGCAVSRKIECIYTYDDKLRRFAEGFINTSHIPEMPKQQELPF